MTAALRHAAVLDRPLSVDRLLRSVSTRTVGGIGLFVGLVRDHDHGDAVASLDYTGHPSAEELLQTCVQTVAARHDVVSVAVEHRVGHLEVGELAVVVAVGAAHRAAALECCRDLIDTVKHEVPIWKEQHLATGGTEWVGLDTPGSETPEPSHITSAAEAGRA